MTNSVKHNNLSLCPLCEEQNFCAVVSNSNTRDCWCRHTEIPKHLISTANQSSLNKRCICQRCAQQATLLATEAH